MAAGLIEKITVTYNGGGKNVSSKIGTYTASKEASVSENIPAGAVDLEIDMFFPFATIQSYIFDSNVPLIIKTNSKTSPGNTINLNGSGTGHVWGIDFLNPKDFTVDVTKLFVSNPGATDADLEGRVAYN